MKTKCLILDDEPYARNLLRDHIEKIGGFEIVAECGDAIEAMNLLRTHPVDLIFSDIQMPELTGIEFIKTLNNPPKFILTTAFRDYALEGYELDVLDYLVKPITFARLLKAVNKYYKYIGQPIKEMEEETQPVQTIDDFIYVRENKRYVKVNYKEILYFEGLGEYIQIFTHSKKIVTKQGLNDLEKKLPSSGFLRIHKSHIVNITKIEAFTAQTIELPGKKLTIGRSYKEQVSEVLKRFK